MAYLNTIETVIQVLDQDKLNQNWIEEKEEYLKLKNPKELKSNSIPSFSFRISGKSADYFTDIINLIKTVLPDIVTQKSCSEEIVNKYLKLLVPSKMQHLPKDQWPRIINFNQFDFNLISKKSKSVLFSEEFYKPFKFGSHYFDFYRYTQFINGALYLNKIFCILISHSSVAECILTIDDVDEFLDDIINDIDDLKPLFKNDSVTLPFYKQYFIEQIAFRLDPYALNKISAVDFISLNDFNSFLTISYLSKENYDEEMNESNPFSYSYFRSIFGAFTNNVNSEGLIEKSSFKHCKDWNFCDCFVDRIYDNSTVFNGCLDFSGFCHFYVNYDNSDTKNGARYLFNLLDVDGDGLVTPLDISYFYKDLVRESESNETAFDVVVQELLDQTQAVDMGFTLDEFISCGASGEIANIMSDYSEFKIYFGHDDLSK